MNKTSLSLAAVFLFAPAYPTPADEPKPSPPPAFAAQGRWNVRVEVLMVALPEEKVLALLPDLRDAAKIDGACTALMEMIRRKEARLTGYPVVNVLDGQQGTSETRLEKIYPTQYESPQAPTAFEKRNTGAQLMAKCQVSEGARSIQAEVLATCTELVGFDAYGTGKFNQDGSVAKIEQPLFSDPTYSGTLGLRNGQRVLLGFHRLVKPAGEVELFILQASAAPLS